MTLPVAESVFFWANWALVFALALGVIATYFIVVSGNAKEAFAKVEASAAAVRETQANERIAQLGKDAAHLSADAEASRAEIAKANARAVEARLALERFKAPRQLVVDDRMRLVDSLKRYASSDAAIYVLAEGPEAQNIAASVLNAIKQAGWNAVSWNWSGGGALVGIGVFSKDGDKSKNVEAAAALAKALNDAHLDSQYAIWPGDWDHFGGSLTGPNPPSPTEAPIRIVIGSKPQ